MRRQHKNRFRRLAARAVPRAHRGCDYRIHVKLDNLYLAVRNDSTDPLTEGHIEQADPVTNRSSFIWAITAAPGNYYNIQNVGTGFYADDALGVKLSGDFLREWWPVNLSTNEAQQWRVIDLGDGAYEIQNVRSGRAFDDFAFFTTPRNPIWLWGLAGWSESGVLSRASE